MGFNVKTRKNSYQKIFFAGIYSYDKDLVILFICQ